MYYFALEITPAPAYCHVRKELYDSIKVQEEFTLSETGTVRKRFEAVVYKLPVTGFASMVEPKFTDDAEYHSIRYILSDKTPIYFPFKLKFTMFNEFREFYNIVADSEELLEDKETFPFFHGEILCPLIRFKQDSKTGKITCRCVREFELSRTYIE